ncbi:MAG: hypothetical protein IPK64_18545 [bacterium]|nr:hypothetical protein [bacterium]
MRTRITNTTTTTITTVAFLALAVAGAAEAHYINLTGGTLAGQPLSATEWIIDVAPGQPITGNILCTAFGGRSGPGVVIPFGYTWTWGSRASAIRTLSNNLPQSASNWNVPINLTAPNEPGVYHILFGLRGEFNMQQVFSATNWTRSVVWNDGNDFHDMDDATLQAAHESGFVSWSWLFNTGYTAADVGVMPIKVIVGSTVPAEATSWSRVKALYR